ncbi:MAG: carotenoid biosynthesis protein [Chloroflexota bacterium]|nr:carotenoid biosynthesis protein [Chloroflexota bacterium]
MIASRLKAARALLDPRDLPAYTLIGAWCVVMVAVPILRWTVGEALFPLDISAGVIAQVAAALIALRRLWTTRALVVMTVVVVCGAWAIEYMGHTTGFPFGAYSYTDRLQPQIGGVPLFVPLAWLMMMPSSWAVAHLLTGDRRGWRGRIAFVGWSALAFTAWDLFLDPQMVSWDLWRWDDPSGFTYFGIPWSNYAGWLLAALLLTTAASAVAPTRRLPLLPLLTIYAVTWFLETFGLILFWGQPGAGIVGGVVMGTLLVAALIRLPSVGTHNDASAGVLP